MAINTSKALAARPAGGAGNASSYVYTTHCWLVSFFIHCPAHWPDLHCPSAELVAAFRDAVSKGWITWHAVSSAALFDLFAASQKSNRHCCLQFPHNGEPETFDAELFTDGIKLCHSLDDEFKKPHATVMSQRDVPGMTRAVIPLLVAQGVRALSVGANGYSASAAVPSIYKWEEPLSQTSVVAMQNPGGYGDGKTVVMPNGSSTHALHFLFNGDNAGPHSVAQVDARHTRLAQQYPSAEISGSTWEAFLDAITADGSTNSLELVKKEEGDTWIYGVQQDLYKTAAFRAIMRARRECLIALGEAKCGGVATRDLANATRFALKMGEHTWGFNWGYMDQRSYSNVDLAYALESVGGFAKTQDGWKEQRRYVDHTLDALREGATSGDEGCAWLLKRTEAELALLRPSEPDTTVQWEELDPTKELSLPQWNALGWNATAGGLSKLVHKKSGHNYARRQGGSLAQYQVQTLDEDDFWTFMNATLKVKREVAYGKFNLSANSDITSGSWTGKLSKMYRSKPQTSADGTEGVDSFLQLVEMPADLHLNSGAPMRAWTRFDVSRNSAHINITLSIFNKTRTRLPEAHWMDFELAMPTDQPTTATRSPQASDAGAGSVSSCDSWVVPKLNSTFCATDVSLFGATHVHAVADIRPLEWTGAGTTVGLQTLDAAVVALEYKSALPEHVKTTLDAGVAAAYVNLCNNFWCVSLLVVACELTRFHSASVSRTTNYPNWYPFAEGDGDAAFRFQLSVNGP